MDKAKLKLIGCTATIAILGTGLLASADTGLDTGNFGVRSLQEEGTKSYRGEAGGSFIGAGTGGDGGGGGSGAIPSVDGFMAFEIDLDAGCDAAGGWFEGVESGTMLISPTGIQTPLLNGFNEYNESGPWAIEGNFTTYGKEIDPLTYQNGDIMDPASEGVVPIGGLESFYNGCLTSIDSWDENLGIETIIAPAAGAGSIEYLALPPSTVKAPKFFFAGLTDTSQTGDIENWDVSNVTDMTGLFYGTYLYNNDGAFDLSGWDTSNVENMSLIFGKTMAFNATGFNQWDMSSVTDLQGAFLGSGVGIDPAAIGGLDVSNVRNFTHTFAGNNNVPGGISIWNTSAATNMSYMFYNSSISYGDPVTGNPINLSGWTVNNVTNYSNFVEPYSEFLASPLFS